jgi:hypothetical protein
MGLERRKKRRMVDQDRGLRACPLQILPKPVELLAIQLRRETSRCLLLEIVEDHEVPAAVVEAVVGAGHAELFHQQALAVVGVLGGLRIVPGGQVVVAQAVVRRDRPSGRRPDLLEPGNPLSRAGEGLIPKIVANVAAGQEKVRLGIQSVDRSQAGLQTLGSIQIQAKMDAGKKGEAGILWRGRAGSAPRPRGPDARGGFRPREFRS